MMMVETMLESPQDIGMMSSSLPQWKREILQRRAARAQVPQRTTQLQTAPPEPSSPPPPPEEDEELRYGPGIVKRLKSRYLSLALREAPRRRPSVLRRATSLEHLLEDNNPPTSRPQAPAAQPQPPSQRRTAQPQRFAPTRRESIKRARSVDALSRLEARDDEKPPAPIPRSSRVPRRPAPLLSESERPPPDVVRAALRKFEPTAPRRTAPAARVSGVLRGLETRSLNTKPSAVASTQTTPSLRRTTGRPPVVPRSSSPRCSTPEPRTRTPSPASAELSSICVPRDSLVDELDDATPPKIISRAALDGIARAGATMSFCFDSARRGSHLPILAATNPVLLGRVRNNPQSPRQIGVIRPMPAQTNKDEHQKITIQNSKQEAENDDDVFVTLPNDTMPVDKNTTVKLDLLCDPPSDEKQPELSAAAVPTVVISKTSSSEKNRDIGDEESVIETRLSNGSDHCETRLIDKIKRLNLQNNVGNAKIDKPSKCEIKDNGEVKEIREVNEICDVKEREVFELKDDREVNKNEPKIVGCSPAQNGSVVNGLKPPTRRPAPDSAATTMVFNFSARKDVPDYIENDGMILKASKKDKLKAGDPGVVLLKTVEKSSDDSDTDSDGESWLMNGPPSPCDVKFINDNVLINGKSSMAASKQNKDRAAKLKLQFDDSLTRTFEYPSEASLSEDRSPSTPLHSNTHLVSASLSSYKPSKMSLEGSFQLGVTRCEKINDERINGDIKENGQNGYSKPADEVLEDADYLKPCADTDGLNWSSESSRGTADLLF